MDEGEVQDLIDEALVAGAARLEQQTSNLAYFIRVCDRDPARREIAQMLLRSGVAIPMLAAAFREAFEVP